MSAANSTPSSQNNSRRYGAVGATTEHPPPPFTRSSGYSEGTADERRLLLPPPPPYEERDSLNPTTITIANNEPFFPFGPRAPDYTTSARQHGFERWNPTLVTSAQWNRAPAQHASIVPLSECCRACFIGENGRTSPQGPLFSCCRCHTLAHMDYLKSMMSFWSFRCPICDYSYSRWRLWVGAFLRSTTLHVILALVVFPFLMYGIARAGRELDEKGTWRWKSRPMDPEEPIDMYWGLDQKDILWALVAVGGLGTMVSEIALNVIICSMRVKDIPDSFFGMILIRVFMAFAGAIGAFFCLLGGLLAIFYTSLNWIGMFVLKVR
ncbi:MAG: hypothetical protein J3Q66DRAFT_323946 [Benniella sp.]|nr:MAG: hypothetical protein J3Q66DRAFT_323946 [Benniella sp.]